MQLGFSLNAFSKTNINFAIETLSKIGYHGIEIVLDLPHAFLPIKNYEINQIKNSLQNNNIIVTNLNSNTVLGWHENSSGNKFEPSLSNKDENLRKWRIYYTKQAIDLAYSLNVPSICVTSGILNKSNIQQELEFFKKSLIILAEYAEPKKILLGIEYEPGLLIDNSENVWNLVSNDFKNIGLNLDTCHAAVLGEKIPDIIEKFGKKIYHTHISDCKNNIHFHLIPGLGDIDFKEIYDSLKKIEYNGFLTAELYTYSDNPEEAASKTFIYLENLMK